MASESIQISQAMAEKVGNLSISERALPTPSPTESGSSTPQTAEAPQSQQQQQTTQQSSAPKGSAKAYTYDGANPNYPKSRISLVDRFIDEPRSLRVAVIGGGLSGITAGVLLPAKVPNIKLTIYEKNHDFVSHHHQTPSKTLTSKGHHH